METEWNTFNRYDTSKILKTCYYSDFNKMEEESKESQENGEPAVKNEVVEADPPTPKVIKFYSGF